MENELFDEYMDHDALSCIDDYNRFEEREIFNDREWDQEPDYDDDCCYYPED